MLAGRVVIGQNIGFDLAMLRHEAARAGCDLARFRPLWMSRIWRVRSIRGLVDLGLEVARVTGFGVTIEARHDALGDSVAAAEIFAALVPRLREVDVRTLGEAEAYAARRTDLVAREVEAGWHSLPGGSPVAPLPPAARPGRQLSLPAPARRGDEYAPTVDSAGRDDPRSRPTHG